MPKISVVIPVYNTEKYLPKCLDSILGQTLTDIEILCINDGSTDGSENVLDEYATKDNRVKVIDLKKNKGVSFARNCGIEMATGEYVAFADSDDYLDTDFYEKLYIKASQTGADIVKGELKEIFPNGKIKIYQQNENIIKYKNKYCFYLNFTSAIYRLSLIKDNRCYFNRKLVHTEDLVWLNRVVRNSDLVEVVSDACYHYLRRDDSADTQNISETNTNSAYVGWKYIFLSMHNVAKTSQLDFFVCYRDYWDSILSFIFRASDLRNKRQFSKLLFFFYHKNPAFYINQLAKNNMSLKPYFMQNNLDGFVDFMKNKRSFADLILANLRYNMSQN